MLLSDANLQVIHEHARISVEAAPTWQCVGLTDLLLSDVQHHRSRYLL